MTPTDTHRASVAKHALLLAFGAILISFSPIFVKFLANDGMGPTAIAFWRMSFGAALFFAFALTLGGNLALTRRKMLFAFLAGLFFACDLSLWHRSIIMVGAGMATILGNTQVFWTALMGHFLYREKLTVLFKAAAPLGLIGIAILGGVGSAIAFTSTYLTGIFLGLGTGVAYALYLIALKQSTHESRSREDGGTASVTANMSMLQRLGEAAAMLAWVSFFGASCLGIGGFFEGANLSLGSTRDLLLLAGLAFVVQLIGWLAIYFSLERLPASRSALIILLQPTFAMIWGQIFFGESLTLLQLGGAALTLAAIYIGAARDLSKGTPVVS